MIHFTLLACLALFPMQAQAEPQRQPLEQLAAQVPLDSGKMVSLADLQAARDQAQLAALPGDAQDLAMVPFAMLSPPSLFDIQGLPALVDGGRQDLGFSVLEIKTMAGWGDLPEAGLILSGPTPQFAAALPARGFEPVQKGSVTVWASGKDYGINPAAGNSDPFTTRMGVSQRFAQSGDYIYFARGWPALEQMLAEGPSIMEDGDFAAILRAAYLVDDLGAPVDILLMREPPVQVDDAAQMVLDPNLSGEELRAALAAQDNARLPGLPYFDRYALALWQNRTTLTGAIVIAFADRKTAGKAQARFAARLAVTENSRGRMLTDLLPATHHFTIVDAAGRAVLILGFQQEIDLSMAPILAAFNFNPRNRILNLFMQRELERLIGIAQAE